MPFHSERLHPCAEQAYLLAVEHGSLTHPLNVAFVEELESIDRFTRALAGHKR
jgi:hypothetical protein